METAKKSELRFYDNQKETAQLSRMKEDLFDPVPTVKLYSEFAVRIGTFLGGPLIAGYLMAENYKQLNEPDKARKTWMYSILATVVIFGLIFFLPRTVRIPTYIIPLSYTLVSSLIFQNYQGMQVEGHIEKGGPLYSIWRVVLIGLIGLLATGVLLFITMFITDRGGF